MLNSLKQARAALSLLNPEEVRNRASRTVHIGLVAAGSAGYNELEDFLVPPSISLEERTYLLDRVHRAGDPVVPPTVDLVLFEHGVPGTKGTYTYDRDNPSRTIDAILGGDEELALALARQFSTFRQPVIDRTIHGVSLENAMFAVTTALPDIVPSLIELPWAFGEFASDTVFITGNQIRMAFVIAAVCGRPVGFNQQRSAVLSIVAGAFGWRALARELAGKIPLGAGLIPKGAIAYAGTFLVGKGLEYLYRGSQQLTSSEQRAIYEAALHRGRTTIAEHATIR
jgi:hypothetical protein